MEKIYQLTLTQEISNSDEPVEVINKNGNIKSTRF